MKTNKKHLIIIGAGSLGVMTLDAALEMNIYENIEFIDDNKVKNTFIHNHLVLGGIDLLQQINVEEYEFIIAIANNKIRKEIAEKFKLNYTNIIHPKTSVSRLAKLGIGNIILPNTSIDPEAKVENHVIINKNNSLGHNVTMKNYSQASPGCNLGGIIGECTFLGLGSTVLPEIEIGEYSIIGAGSVVTKSLSKNVTVVGVPAKVIKEGTYVK